MRLNAQQLRQLKQSEELPKIKRIPIYFILENIYDTYNVGGLFRLADALAIEKIYLCGETETPPNAKIKKASIGTYKIVPWEYRKTAGEVIKELRETLNVYEFRGCHSERKRRISCECKTETSSEILRRFTPQDDSKCETREVKRHLSGMNKNKKFNVERLKFNAQIIAVEQSPGAIPYTKASYQLPLALIFGNETYGISPETLKLTDQIVDIPMFGINKSLNVIVSAAIVGYYINFAIAAKTMNTTPKKA